MHIEISPSEEAYREDIDMCSRCDIFVLTLIAHISFYLTDTLAYCVNISKYCVYRLSSVPFSAYRFSDLGAYHITRFIRITQILEIYCSVSKIYCTCCRVLQKYRILGEKWYQNWGKTACHPSLDCRVPCLPALLLVFEIVARGAAVDAARHREHRQGQLVGLAEVRALQVAYGAAVSDIVSYSGADELHQRRKDWSVADRIAYLRAGDILRQRA